MLIEHQGQRPRIHATAYIAPTATICGQVTIGENSRVLFGAVITAEGGDPAQILPADQHDKIWAIQEPLDFPGEVFGLERAPAGETIMPELTRRYTRFLSKHQQDLVLDGE